jgi:aminoglycoside phosphotransferase
MAWYNLASHSLLLKSHLPGHMSLEEMYQLDPNASYTSIADDLSQL